jgi:hypothetical protein
MSDEATKSYLVFFDNYLFIGINSPFMKAFISSLILFTPRTLASSDKALSKNGSITSKINLYIVIFYNHVDKYKIWQKIISFNFLI